MFYPEPVSGQVLSDVLERATGSSLHAAAGEMKNGFLHAPGGVRVGVCGTAALEDRTIVVRDVHEFPGHIACDSASNSEIVVPLHFQGDAPKTKIIGVLDVDSTKVGRFGDEERAGLERVARVIGEVADWGTDS